MALWLSVLIHAAAAALAVLVVLAGFYRWVLRPYLDRKVAQIEAAAEDVEARVNRGVRAGVAESLRELPEATVRDSTRQFLKFGSDLFENGLSSFLGSTADLQRRPGESGGESGGPGHRR